MKFDVFTDGGFSTERSMTRSALGMSEDEELIVAGSTHPTEEEVLLESYRTLARSSPKVILLLAPRHIERGNVLAQTIQKFGLSVMRRSQFSKEGRLEGEPMGPRVILLDTRGELAQVYGLALMAFVGGSLVPIGGHNLLEPAVWGKPVCFGPYTDHCQEIAELLIETGGGIRVRNGEELTEIFMKGIQDRDWVSHTGQKARKVVDDNQGVVEKNLNMIEEVINFREPHHSPSR